VRGLPENRFFIGKRSQAPTARTSMIVRAAVPPAMRHVSTERRPAMSKY
jgi:hypothetical protein